MENLKDNVLNADILLNKINTLQEDLMCVHMYLDDCGIPTDNNGNAYSIVGRIKLLQKIHLNSISNLETEIRKTFK